VQAFVHVTQLSAHRSPNLAVYNLGIWVWSLDLYSNPFVDAYT